MWPQSLKRTERRLACVSVDPAFIVEAMFARTENFPKMLSLPWFSPLPADARVVGITYDFMSQRFRVAIASEAFAEVADGAEMPEIKADPEWRGFQVVPVTTDKYSLDGRRCTAEEYKAALLKSMNRPIVSLPPEQNLATLLLDDSNREEIKARGYITTNDIEAALSRAEKKARAAARSREGWKMYGPEPPLCRCEQCESLRRKAGVGSSSPQPGKSETFIPVTAGLPDGPRPGLLFIFDEAKSSEELFGMAKPSGPLWSKKAADDAKRLACEAAKRREAQVIAQVLGEPADEPQPAPAQPETWRDRPSQL